MGDIIDLYEAVAELRRDINVLVTTLIQEGVLKPPKEEGEKDEKPKAV